MTCIVRTLKIFVNFRLKYLRISKKLHQYDGLSSIEVTNIKVTKFPLYTWIYVKVDKTSVRNKTEELVKKEYDLWMERRRVKKRLEEEADMVQGNFKKMPPREGGKFSSFEDIPLQKFELDILGNEEI